MRIEEQKRIVSILDEAFEGLERARENAEANLKSARELFESFVSEQLISVNADEYSLSEMLEKGWITSHLDGNHGGNYPRNQNSFHQEFHTFLPTVLWTVKSMLLYLSSFRKKEQTH